MLNSMKVMIFVSRRTIMPVSYASFLEWWLWIYNTFSISRYPFREDTSS